MSCGTADAKRPFVNAGLGERNSLVEQLVVNGDGGSHGGFPASIIASFCINGVI